MEVEFEFRAKQLVDLHDELLQPRLAAIDSELGEEGHALLGAQVDELRLDLRAASHAHGEITRERRDFEGAAAPQAGQCL